jgi:hypothetical protein
MHELQHVKIDPGQSKHIVCYPRLVLGTRIDVATQLFVGLELFDQIRCYSQALILGKYMLDSLPELRQVPSNCEMLHVRRCSLETTAQTYLAENIVGLH